jgi:chloride channel 7
MLDGATRMMISLTVILLETTKNIQYLLPLTTTLMVSKFVGDFFNISIYEMVSSATPYPPCPELRMRTVLTAESVSRLSPST